MGGAALPPALHGRLLSQRFGRISRDEPPYRSILDEWLTLADGPDPPVSKE